MNLDPLADHFDMFDVMCQFSINSLTEHLIALRVQIFHKVITSGHQRLQPLFDCLLTIIVNSEYIESEPTLQ